MAEHLFNKRSIEATAMSSNITSDPVSIKEATAYAVQAIWSAGSTPVGEFDVQGSNDGATFTSILDAPIAVSGDTGNLLVNVEEAGYNTIRLVYTRTSGDGTLDAYVNAQKA